MTHDPRTLTKPDDRSAAIDQLDRARKNFEIHDAKAPYSLKVSFETNGATQLEGRGTMEEFYDGLGQFRWTAQLGDVRVTRVGADHRVYGSDASEPIPLRIQLVRTVLLKPVQYDIATFVIRGADVELDGKQLTCFLLIRSQPSGPGPRDWRERENCVDPATGLLRMWSEAPGIYAMYDYYGGDFHGHVLRPGRFPFTKKGDSLCRFAWRAWKTRLTWMSTYSSPRRNWARRRKRLAYRGQAVRHRCVSILQTRPPPISISL